MKGVLFDFWGTLVENGIMPSPVRQTRYLMGLKMPFGDFIVRFEEVFMTKQYEDLYAAFAAACEEFDIKPEKELLDKLVGMQNKNDMLCKPFPETFEVLQGLKDKGLKIGLISNTPPSIRRVIEKFGMEEYFDAIVLSCDTGFLKTNPKMFETVLKELGLEKEEVLMVGDSIETDVKGAQKAGVRPVLVDRRDRREYPEKILDLKGLDKYLEG